MELSNDIRIAHFAPFPAGFAADSGARACDWAGLFARFSAAHALRRELIRAESRVSGPLGSFSDWALPGCDEAPGKRPVNLKDSTDRKGPWGIEAEVAGPIHDGDREL